MVEDQAEAAAAAPATFTFLFTDIEGSTRLLTELGAAFSEVLRTHHEILREAIESHGGVVERTEGDAFFALFPTAQAAVSAAVDAQRRLATEPWPRDDPLKVRMGLHTGEAARVDDELVGLDIHRAARIAAVGWGGQVLVSEASRQLLSGERADIELRDLGAHRLKDLDAPQHLYQVVCSGLREDFPALRSLDHLPNNLPSPSLIAFSASSVARLLMARFVRSARSMPTSKPAIDPEMVTGSVTRPSSCV